MRAKLQQRSNNKTTNSLWRDSPCSANYVLQNPSVDIAERFQIGSIYYRDQVNKPKKVFTAFQKPDLLLQEFRRQVEEVDYQQTRRNSKNKMSRQKQKSRAKSLTTTVDSKFYQIPLKNQYKYDRNGVRSHLAGEYDIKQIEGRIMSARVNFGSSHRVDLSKPLNFFPGPGTYDYGVYQNKSGKVAKVEPKTAKLPMTMRTHSIFKNHDSRQISHPKTERNIKNQRSGRNSVQLHSKSIQTK